MNKIFFGLTLLVVLGCNKTNQTNSIQYSKDTITEATQFAQGVISTNENSEFEIMFAPDGLTAYFSRRAPGEKQKYTKHFFQMTVGVILRFVNSPVIEMKHHQLALMESYFSLVQSDLFQTNLIKEILI